MTDEMRGGPSQSIGQVIEDVLGEKLSGVNDNQRLLALWLMANGERERTHTVGVYLAEPRGKQKLPRLTVYVDTNACVVDFNASREVYLARMEGVGLKLSAVDFRLSRYAEEHRERMREQNAVQEEPLPELTDEERQFVEKLIQDVPENLRSSVSKAISSSLRREKAEGTQND